MFNSVAFDVVIGMVFMYLLYSLLATILSEMAASWIGLRARVLRKAIERMLNDGYNIELEKSALKKGMHYASDFFLHEQAVFEHSLAGRFYDYPSIKYLSEGTKKFLAPFGYGKPSYISKEHFARTMLHLFRSRGNGSSDAEKIDFCLRFNTLHIQPQTLSYLRNLLTDSGKDVDAFTGNLGKWFDETMDRTSGWYKRKQRLILFLIGFFIAASFNVNSILIATKLAKDKSAREQLVQLSIAASDTGSSISRALKNTRDSTTTDSLARVGYRSVQQSVDDANQVLGLGWKGKDFKQVLSAVFTMTEFPFTFWGFLLTAFALSLGAPFWFDLLQKLVALRSSGVKPETKPALEDKAPGVIPGGARANVQPGIAVAQRDELELAIERFKALYGRESGIIKIGKGFVRTRQAKVRAIEVHLDGSGTRDSLSRKAGKKFEAYAVQYLVNSRAVPHGLKCGDTIYNSSKVNGPGTLGCFLHKPGSSKRYLLSCWHVVKGDFDWNNTSGPDIINNFNDEAVGRIVDGTLTDKIDAGFVELLPGHHAGNTPPGIRFDWRDVSPDDALDETAVRFVGAASTAQQGVIYDNAVDHVFEYPFIGDHELHDLFSVTAYDDNGLQHPISEKGDSGAVVVDNKDRPLGIVVGGDALYTYVVKFSNIYEIEGYRQYRIMI